MTLSRVRLPVFVLVPFEINLILSVAYLADYLAGRPFLQLTILLDLNGEANLPAWYSSVQLFLAAALIGLFAWHHRSPRNPRSWLLALLPLVLFAFSLDEAAQIHEWLGVESDVLLAGDTREETPFWRTGIWMFLLGLPFVALFGGLLFLVRGYFRLSPGALLKIGLGMGILLAGAIGIETLSNQTQPGSAYDTLQVFGEELLEMMGGTMILWGAYELLTRHGFTFALPDPPAVNPGESP